jgi:hypothetical protein
VAKLQELLARRDTMPLQKVMAITGGRQPSRHLRHPMSEDRRTSCTDDQDFQPSCISAVWFELVDSHVQHRCGGANDKGIKVENEHRPSALSSSKSWLHINSGIGSQQIDKPEHQV